MAAQTKAQLAKAFGVPETDPRLDQLLQKAAAKGYMPSEFASFAAGNGPKPERQDWGPEGPPEWLAPGGIKAADEARTAANPVMQGQQALRERVAEDQVPLKDKLMRMARGAGEAVAAAPEQLAADPLGAARALQSNVAGGGTLGAFGPQANYERARQTYAEVWRTRKAGGMVSDNALRRAEEEFQRAKADLDASERHQAVAVTGDLMGGGVGVGGRVAGSVTRGLPTGTAAQRVLRTTAGGMAGGAVEGGGRALAAGEDLDTVVDRTLEGAQAGGTVGAAGGVAGEAIGVARRGVQAASPWVRERAKAIDSGRLQATAGQSKEQAVLQTRDRILSRDAEISQAERQAYKAVEDQVRGRAAPLEPVVDDLVDLQSRTRYAAGDVRPDARGISAKADDMFDSLTASERTVGDLLDTRRGVGRNAGFGAPSPTPEQLADQDIYHALNKSLHRDEVAPGLAAADKRFTDYKRVQARRNDILFGNEDGGRAVDLPDEALAAADIPDAQQVLRVADEKKAGRVLERLGDDSVPARETAPYLDQLRSQDPGFAAALDDLMAVKAREATKLLTLNPGVRTTLSPAVEHVGTSSVGTMPMELVKQYGRGLTARGDDVLATGQAAARSPGLSATIGERLKAASEENRRRGKKLRKQP